MLLYREFVALLAATIGADDRELASLGAKSLGSVLAANVAPPKTHNNELAELRKQQARFSQILNSS